MRERVRGFGRDTKERQSQVSEKQRERGQKSNQRNKRIRDRAIKSQKL